MIARAPHNQEGILHPTFAPENRNVAGLLTSVLKYTNEWTWMKGSARVYNGQRMFTNLKTHYLGASNTDNNFDEA